MNPLPKLSMPPPPWRRPVAVLLLALVVLGLLYRETFAAMVGIWARSDTFAHAFLVAPISVWLIWRQRAVLATMPPQADWRWLLVAAPVALGWFVGQLAGVNALTQFAATALLVLTVPTLLGTAVAYRLLFPLAFLFFMVPFGEFVMPTLMRWTADVTVFGVKSLGIPVFREGLQFVIPSGTWSVVEACSGVRYLIASFMVGTLFAYLNYASPWRRVAFGVVSLLVPIVANWARAVMIVLLGHYSGNELAAGADHLIYGWAFFGVVIGVMFFIGGKWADAPLTVAAPTAESAERHPVVRPGNANGRLMFSGGLMLVLLCAPAAAVWHLQSGTAPVLSLATRALPLPMPPQSPTVPFVPGFEGARAEVQQQFSSNGLTVAMHVAYYQRQTYGHKLVSSQNALVRSKDETWRVSESATGTVDVAGRAIPALVAEVRRGTVGVSAGPEGTLQVRQVYWVGGQWVASGPKASLLAVWHLLTGRGDDAAAVTFTLAGVQRDATGAQLDAFVAQHLGTIGDWLGKVRQPQ